MTCLLVIILYAMQVEVQINAWIHVRVLIPPGLISCSTNPQLHLTSSVVREIQN